MPVAMHRADSTFASIALSLAVGVSALIAASSARAEFDPYMVRNLRVSASAADAVAAKAEAMAEAARIGAARVIGRIAVGAETERAADIDAVEAEKLISTIEIAAETIGRTGYAAEVNLLFSPLLVRGYLARHQLGVADVPAPLILLVPILFENGVPRAWEAAEVWAQALRAAGMEEGLTPVVLPRNSRYDRQADLDRIIAGDRIALQELRIRYRAQGVVVARLDTESSTSAMLLGLRGEDGAGAIDLTMEIGDGGFAGAAGRVAAALSGRWKAAIARRAGVTIGIDSSMPVRVLFAGPDGWTQLRQRLERSKWVTGLAVEGMEASAANVVLWYSGRLDDLPRRLAEDGLDLFQAGNAWLLQSY
ncbi:uncharacterized protein DUF2066 [Tepidamorphus gemmatus]|uniref:Uncharacterized protein DUF2066 n=2 Tax=Tepidamorphus gemmatus TaxID=747076 RepID=A0A4R3MIV9_9HYPH|nr:uncharacterized protein DUF2066 [Tepidamorphus gemmatus]